MKIELKYLIIDSTELYFKYYCIRVAKYSINAVQIEMKKKRDMLCNYTYLHVIWKEFLEYLVTRCIENKL